MTMPFCHFSPYICIMGGNICNELVVVLLNWLIRNTILHGPWKILTSKVLYDNFSFLSSLVYISNCYIVYLSLLKDSNDFHKLVSWYDFKCKLRLRTILVIFLLSSYLTTCKAITKSCTIGLICKPLFEVLTQRCHLVVEKKKEILAKRSERSERSARPSRRGVQGPA